jgi:hypothetical protein
MKYTAVIVEPRNHKALHFVVNNILENLSEEWNVIIFHGITNETFCNNIVEALGNNKRLSLINLGIDNLTSSQYSRLLTTESFYESIPTDMILVFQTDSMIFSKNKDIINDLLKYDYVGSPWVMNNQVGNGGFSLRRKAKMIEIIKTKRYWTNENEDVYFSRHTTNKPTFEEAKRFSIETIFSPQSFGCHKPWIFGFNEKMLEQYPEVNELYLLNDVPKNIC